MEVRYIHQRIQTDSKAEGEIAIICHPIVLWKSRPRSLPEFVDMARRFARSALMRFGLCGVGINAMAFALNTSLVELAGMDPVVSYAIVLCVVLLVGYITNLRYVFRREDTPRWRFLLYTAAFFTMRGGDWCVYTAMVRWLGIHYLLAQGINLFIFFFAKFFLYGAIIKHQGQRPQVARAKSAEEPASPA
jgi:putative flippase GtrA